MKYFFLNSETENEIKKEIEAKEIHTGELLNFAYDGAAIDSFKFLRGQFSAIAPVKNIIENNLSINKSKPIQKFDLHFKEESSSQVINAVFEVIEKMDLSGCFSELGTHLTTVISELVRNGIVLNFQNLNFKYVDCEIIEAEDEIIVTVEDEYGKLLPEEIVKRLREVAITGNYERKVYGAGLGLFMTVNSVDYIKFEVVPDAMTRVICKVKKYKRLKQFKEKQPIIIYMLKEKSNV